MSRQTDCCGSLIRVILSTINIIFLLFGIAIFVIGAILRWNSTAILNDLIHNDDFVVSMINIINDGIYFVSYSMLVLGAFIILLSMFGLIGACCANRFFLVLYETVLILLLLFHTGVLLYAVFKSPSIEREFARALNNSMDLLNNGTSEQQTTYCHFFKGLSDIFSCCGANGPHDFVNQSLVHICCDDYYTRGCSNRTIDTIRNNSVYIVLLPNSMVLVFEFLIIVMVPYLVGRIGRELRRKRLAEDSQINFQPTTYGIAMPKQASSYSYKY